MSQLRLRPTGKTGLAADLLGGPRLAGTVEHSVRWAQMDGSLWKMLPSIYWLPSLSKFLDTVYLYTKYSCRVCTLYRTLITTHDEDSQNLPDFLTGYSEALPLIGPSSAGAPHLTF